MTKRLLICDLDNTLYDWVGYFVNAFYAMTDEIVAITQCDHEKLLDDFREVHRRHHDSEHPFALLETETIKKAFPNRSAAETLKILDRALYAFNAVRKNSLQLYPGVRETLDALNSEGVSLVAHTESKLYATIDRLTRLDLTKYFSHIYCRERPDSAHPRTSGSWDKMKEFPMDRVVELSHHQRKPNVDVLLEICAREGVSPRLTAYIGDSLTRDVLMAKRAGVLAIWAKYGTIHEPGSYERLVRITHWTPDDVEREKELQNEAKAVAPDFVAEQSFSEVILAVRGMMQLHA
ncbi:HAD family hydrolase [Parvibaculum sp.]|uniref:HAD family hydrolase n=1 Tax=Parvibaculum sp. TaxID=2024848 RepID=UPI0034A00149